MVIKIIKITGLIGAFVLLVGTSAYLTLSLIIKSEDTVIVPDLIGKDAVYALEILTELGLNIKIKGSEYHTDIQKNHVIDQESEPGAEIKKGRDVRIIISKGRKTLLMPDLKGLSIQQARLVIEENNLCQGQVTRAYSRKTEEEKIFAQFPPPGTVIQRDTCADFLVSRGKMLESYMMGSLKGLSLEDAVQAIEDANLVIGEIGSSFHEALPINAVVNQIPPAGHRVYRGETVHVVMNRSSDRQGKQTPGETGGVRLFRYRIPDGFLKRHIRLHLNSFGFAGDVYDTFLKPGEEIWLLIPGNRDASLFLYENEKLVKTEIYAAY